MKRILVTGGSGFIGEKLCAALTSCGHHVAVLTRDRNRRNGASQFVYGDLSIRGGLANLNIAEFDVLIHCAGEVKSPVLMRAVHVEGTKQLLELTRRKSLGGARELHWVQLSSVGAYGPTELAARDRHVTEVSAQNPVGDYETTKTESDHLVLDAAGRGDVTCSILRPSNVFGSGMPNQSLLGLISMVKRGLFFYIGRPGAMANYVHVDDVVTALMKCAFEPQARGETYNLSNDCLLEDLIKCIASILAVPRPRVRISESLIRPVVRVFEGWLSIPLTQSRIDALVNKTRYPADKIISELGFMFLKPMPVAIEDLIQKDA